MCRSSLFFSFFFFFNDTATTEIYTLSLLDALPISRDHARRGAGHLRPPRRRGQHPDRPDRRARTVAGQPPGRERDRCRRSEEHTSELQSQSNLVCRLLLEKKKKMNKQTQDQQVSRH